MGPWDGAFRNRFTRLSACFLYEFSVHCSTGSNLAEMKGTAEQNKAVLILGDYSADIDMLMLTLEESSHSHPDVFLCEGIWFHKNESCILDFRILQINFDKMCE